MLHPSLCWHYKPGSCGFNPGLLGAFPAAAFPAAELQAWKLWAGFPGPAVHRQPAWQSSHKAQILRALHLLREIDIWVETEKPKHTKKDNFTEQLGYGDSAHLEALHFIP